MAEIHACPKPNRGMLPSIIHDAAMKGNTREVLTWLEQGGDINAADISNHTLVFTACNNKHVQLLKELLKHPKVHLNQETMHQSNFSVFSPLGIACYRESVECVEALISSPSECYVDLETKRAGFTYQTIISAASKNRWDFVEVILKTDYILEENDACTLMSMAVKVNEMDIIRNIMQRESILYKNHGISNVLQEIYKHNKWDETNCDAVFRKTVLNNNDFTLNVLLLVLEKKDWNRLEMLLGIMVDAIKINSRLAEAIFKKASTDVERILTQEHMEVDVMNGALLVASIGGTSEQIVGMLFGQKNKYSAQIMDNAFMLACRYCRLELLSTLFKRESFGYKTLCRAKSSTRNFGVVDLVDRALKKAAKEIIPLDEDDENET